MPRKYDFKEPTKQIVAQRVNYVCSNPNCLVFTSGPNANPLKPTITGDCGHINSGSENGPRPSKKSLKELTHPDNAIWLCKNCHKQVDSDESNYSEEQLKEWRSKLEERIDRYKKHNSSPLKFVEEMKDNFSINGEIPSEDINFLFGFYKEEIDLYQVMHADDYKLKMFLFFGMFKSTLTATNRFYYNDILAQVYINIGDNAKAIEHLKASLDCKLDIPKRLLNEGLLAYANHELSKVSIAAERLVGNTSYCYLLKTLAISNTEELESLFMVIKEMRILDVNVLANVGIKAREYNNIHICREATKFCLAQEPTMPAMLYTCAQNIIYSLTEDKDIDFDYPDLDCVDDLKVAIRILTELAESHSLSDNIKNWTCYFLANGYFLLGSYPKSMEFLDKLGFADDFITYTGALKVRLLNKTGQFNVSIAELQSLLERNVSSQDLKYLKAICLLRLKSFDEASQIVDEELDKGDSCNRTTWIKLHAELLHWTIGKSESDIYLTSQYEESRSIELLIENLFLNYYMSNKEEIGEYYELNIYPHVKDINRILEGRLALFLYHKEQFRHSSDLWGSIYSVNMNNTYKEYYFKSLISIGNRILALKLLREVRESTKVLGFIPYEAQILEEMHRIIEAEDLALQLFANNPNTYTACLYAHCLIINGDKSKAKDILLQYTNTPIGSIYDFTNYCSLLRSVEEYSALVDVLYEYIRHNQQDQKAIESFIYTFLSFSRDVKFKALVSKYENQIYEDSGVVLESETGFIFVLLYDHPDANPTLNEYNSNSDWWNLLLGKNKEDEFSIDVMDFQCSYKIMDIQHRLVIKFNELLRSHASSSLKTSIMNIPINLANDPTEEIRSKFIKPFTRKQTRLDEIESIYEKSPIPLAFLAICLGKSTITTYLHYFYNSTVRYWASSGDVKDTQEAVRRLSNSTSLTLDISSCLFISEFKLWDMVSSVFKLYISQSTYQSFSDYIDKELSQQTETAGHLTFHNDLPMFVKTDKAVINQTIATYNELLDTLNTHTQMICESEELNFYDVREKHNLNRIQNDMLDTNYIETMVVALVTGSIIYSEDLGFRIVSKEYGINSVWGQVVIDYCHEKRLLKTERLLEITTKLLSYNYHFVHITSNLLSYAIQKSNYQLNPDVEWLLSSVIDCQLEVIQNIMVQVITMQDNAKNLEDVLYMFLNKIWSKFKNMAAINSTRACLNLAFFGWMKVEVNRVFDDWAAVVPGL